MNVFRWMLPYLANCGIPETGIILKIRRFPSRSAWFKADDIEKGCFPVLLAKLYHRVRLLARFRIDYTDRIHWTEKQR